MRWTVPLLAAGLLFCLALPAFSQTILVWDKDHNTMFVDPEGAGSVDATYGVRKALSDNGYDYRVMSALPADLSPFKTILVVMGTYC